MLSNVQKIREKISLACKRVGREEKEVRLIAVSKGRSEKEIRGACDAGVREFGENRVQEALEKREAFPKDCVLHMVGHLQSNKARDAVALFDLIHSIDSIELARKISKCAKNAGKAQKILLEVNVSGEASKYGFAPKGVEAAVREIALLENVELGGLMAIAPNSENPENSRLVFRTLRLLRDEVAGKTGVALSELSMGMTNDFEAAIEEGATMVRVGRGVFD